MKILQRAQNDFKTIGIGLQCHRFNSRNLLVLFIMCMGIISNVVYFFGIAKTFSEYTKSVFVANGLVSASIIYAYVVWKMRQFFNLLEEAEVAIDSSEFDIFFIISNDHNKLYLIFSNYKFQGLENPVSQTIYKKFNQKTEKITSIINSAAIKILYPNILMPTLIASFYAYFTTDLGNDAFQLPFPYWYENFSRFNSTAAFPIETGN